MVNKNANQQVKKIEDLVKLFEKLQIHFQAQEAEILEALYLRLDYKYNFEWIGDVWEVDMSFEDALVILQDFDFSILRNTIKTDLSLIPKYFRIIRKVKFKSKGAIWIIHKYDQDPFPSCPHAHNIENGIKLDLSNGKCYRIRQHISTISKKELIEIRSEASKVFKGDLPKLSI